jgi:HTH-type transcriptional regulator/antitoxin HigA
MENIRPVRTEADYVWAIDEITRYFDKQPEIGSADGDRFDVLATLIEAYEERHYPIVAPDPVATIVAHMEMADLPRAALADVLGSASRASEILNRKRSLTMDMVFRLHRAWKMPTDVLIQPYDLAGGRRKRVKSATQPPKQQMSG